MDAPKVGQEMPGVDAFFTHLDSDVWTVGARVVVKRSSGSYCVGEIKQLSDSVLTVLLSYVPRLEKCFSRKASNTKLVGLLRHAAQTPPHSDEATSNEPPAHEIHNLISSDEEEPLARPKVAVVWSAQCPHLINNMMRDSIQNAQCLLLAAIKLQHRRPHTVRCKAHAHVPCEPMFQGSYLRTGSTANARANQSRSTRSHRFYRRHDDTPIWAGFLCQHFYFVADGRRGHDQFK